MKTAAFTLGAFAALAAAQDLSVLPECGHFCATSMWGSDKAQELGCDSGDLACLCQNENFIYGLRDCSSVLCSTGDAREIVNYGLEVCRDAGVQITATSGISASATGGEDSATISTIFSTLTTDGSAIVNPVSTATITSGEESESSSATPTGSAIMSTFTTDGSAIVTTLSTVTSNASSGESESTASETQPDSTETNSEGEVTGTATESEGEAPTESEGAAAPQRVFAPAAVLGAGLALLML